MSINLRRLASQVCHCSNCGSVFPADALPCAMNLATRPKARSSFHPSLTNHELIGDDLIARSRCRSTMSSKTVRSLQKSGSVVPTRKAGSNLISKPIVDSPNSLIACWLRAAEPVPGGEEWLSIEREKIPWRELPHLRIEEAVEIAGVSRRTVTGAIEAKRLEVRHLGRIPMIPTAEFRRWIGEEVVESDPHSAGTISTAAHAKADSLLRKVG